MLRQRVVTDPSAQRPPTSESEQAYAELIELLGSLPSLFLGGDREVLDPQSRLEGFPWALSILHVGVLAQLWADADRPNFVDIVGPELKWGGDNADAFYCHAAVDPARTYRVWGDRGDAVYFSLTVYGGPRDGRYSERIVTSINDEGLFFDADGRFELLLGPVGGLASGPADRLGPDRRGATGASPTALPYLTLEDDAVVAITRDYQAEPGRGRRVEWHIECLDPAPRRPLTDADLARRLRAVVTWLREQTAFQPLGLGERNVVDDPYPVPTTTFGWAAGDAAYAMGRFALGPDEALVVRGTSPPCRFWNLCLWNPFLHTYDYRAGRVTLNGHQVVLAEDGSWEIVIAGHDPGHPNWIDTQGHTEGLLWFRWFLPAETPARPTTEVVPLP